ncbi:hypothetical protein BGZ60DRAFT_509652 [Tricladium varicosporioides]|nr:hypothetical protein BGZ60DRAFT_509652 [Hymenoscyphus varicosporioides]
MQFLYILSSLSLIGTSLSLPIDTRSNNLDLTARNDANDAVLDTFTGELDPSVLATLTQDRAKADDANANTKANANSNSNGNTAKATGGSTAAATGGKKPTADAVQTAADNFAKDANTVSASLNQLPSETDATKIKALATTAFKAESDEDAQRAVLFAADPNGGASANAKIVKNTPTVLDGLSNIQKNPTPQNVAKMVDTIAAARNPQILPSITQLSNSAMKAVGLPAAAQKFPATNQ